MLLKEVSFLDIMRLSVEAFSLGDKCLHCLSRLEISGIPLAGKDKHWPVLLKSQHNECSVVSGLLGNYGIGLKMPCII